MTERENKLLCYGDNLEVMREHVDDESVDLIYLDPPFNSNAKYSVLFKDKDGNDAPAQIKAFEDTWHWDQAAHEQFYDTVSSGGPVADALTAFETLMGRNDMLAYLTMMAPRLVEMRRKLKKTGSIYLHCDPTASHYLKVLMDAVFGAKFFRNEITWKRTSAHGGAKRYGRVTDIIFFYTKSAKYTWNPQKEPYDDKYLARYKKDEDGKYWDDGDLTGSGTREGESGDPWRGVDPTDKGRHWALPKKICTRLGITTGTVQERLDALYEAGYIHTTSTGGYRLKKFLDEMGGNELQNLWTDISPINAKADERLDYPTQKPLALLERIIQSSSNEGDIVMDPFCGCGTAIVAAEKLGRRWIGIDITHLAIGFMRHRLFDQFGDDIDLSLRGEPKTYAAAVALAEYDKYQFQWWALGKVGARPAKEDQKKGADGGIDGRLYFEDDGKKTKQILISVKGGKNVSVSMVRDLIGTLHTNKAQIGVLVSLAKPTKPMRREATNAGFYTTPWGRFHKIQLLTVEDLLDDKRIKYPGRGAHNVSLKKVPKVKTEIEQGKFSI